MRSEPNVDRTALLSDARDEDKVEAVRIRPPRARPSNKWNKFWIACLVGTGLLASVFMLLGASYILQLYSLAVQRLPSKNPQCDHPIERGDCAENLRRWAWNTANRTCVPFSYSGCGGNKNIFKSQTDCEVACVTIIQI
ncbi:Papilin [Clonorchis sinensis]|uniref:Papilin n=2 Tax=Clonorchis sinensis TaxID=79923 RepID=A0A8T1MPL4_CLOSI|nr:Papilin [Clonorchis sinensis]GAA55361.1 papilin [Clonorchis sinensis]